MVEISAAQRPEGRVDLRLVRNLRPGYWIWPEEWTNDEPHRQWALVVGHPVTLSFGRDHGRICVVHCMWPDGNELELQERPSRDGRVIIPGSTFLQPVQHEVTLLSDEHPKFPGLGMSTVEALPERAPEVAVRSADKALENDLVSPTQTDLIVEDFNPVTGRRRYQMIPDPSGEFFTAELLSGDDR